MSLADEPALRLPYPGLRSFQRDESDLFFGREGTVNEMINRLRPNHFLAVLGTSGSGKSSLVRIGLLDGLELGLLSDAGARWRIVDFAPGADPMRNLARELVRLSGGSANDVDFLDAFLRRGPRSLIEWCKDGHLPQGANLLLLVDQFEELFRYQGYSERQAAEAFVALLIESARNREVPIYVVMTMRSEYLGACALIEGLAEIINDGQFLTPRLNRDQCREAIVGPAEVCGTVIEDDLVNRLLNDLEDFAPWDDRDSGDQLDRLVRRADQLPLLQHTLNRLWLRADAQRTDKTKPIVLRLADYEAIGGLRGAINAHADEILNKLTPVQQKKTEQVFRALTDGKSIATAVRRPTRFDELVAICDGDEPNVRAVVDAFRETGVNFLRPDTSQPLTAATIVDISHESLIRQWRKLSGWLLEEAREAQEWMRLGEAAARYRAGEGSLFHGQDLHLWREHARPTAAWARRYNQPYDETLAFLDKSIAADRRGRRMRSAAIAAAFVVIVGFGGFGGLIWYLVGLNSQLNEQTAAALQAGDQLALRNAELSEAQAELAKTVASLEQARDQLRNYYLASFDSDVETAQRNNQWPEAGAQLGAMLETTAASTDGERTYNTEVLDAARMRLAAQEAFPVWGPADAALGATPTGSGRFDAEVGTAIDGQLLIRLTDVLTGSIVAESAIAESQYPDRMLLVTPDGSDVAFVDSEGTILRWQTKSGEIVEYGPLGEATSSVRASALDPDTGAIAVVLFKEDSALLVLNPDSGSKLRSPIASLFSADDEEEFGDTTMDGSAVWFFEGSPVIAFQPDGGSERFAVVEVSAKRATVLPESVTSVRPSADGKLLFVLEQSTPKPPDDEQTTFLVGPEGNLLDLDGLPVDASADPAAELTLGVVKDAELDIDVLGRLRPDADDRSAMVVADVLPLVANGSTGQRVIIDDNGNSEGPRFLAIDLKADDGPLAAVSADTAAGHGAPLIAATGHRFLTATPTEPWAVLPISSSSTPVVWFDPVSEHPVSIAAVETGDVNAWPALRLESRTADWPEEKLGPLTAVDVAEGAGNLIVVSGRYGGIQRVGAGTALQLREMSIGRECRFAVGESLDVVQLVSWTSSSPLFFGLDASGRVLRFEALMGGAGAGASVGTGVLVRCIGHVRRDAVAAVLPDPAGDRVFLQTDPQLFAVLPRTVESEKEFNEAQTIELPAPASLAAYVPGATPTLAAVDAGGRLSLMRGDPDWRTVPKARTVIVASPVSLTATGDRLLSVGADGSAIIVDLSGSDLAPVAAGRVPHSAFGYRLLADGRTVESVVAGSTWRTELAPLPPVAELARMAEAAAGVAENGTDQDLATNLMGGQANGADAGLALDADALCYLAANGVLEAWRAEAGQGTPGARLTGAREEALARCTGTGPIAALGQRLATAPHYISPALDPWPVQWSALLHDSLAGNRLASRAILIGLSNSSDAFAAAAGDWLANSRLAAGLEVPEEALQSAAAGGDIDPALRTLAEEQRETYEPAIHELLGHLAARSSDPERLREAWVHFRVAELLYRHQVGREAEANRTVALRARIGRALSGKQLVQAWNEAGAWTADIAALPVGDAPSDGESVADRMRADADLLAAKEADGDDPYHLLQAYLWLNLVELESQTDPEKAAASYARFADVLTALPPVNELPDSIVAALSEVSLTLAERAVDASLAMPNGGVALVPFFLGVAEPEAATAKTWDAASLESYTQMIGAITTLVAGNPDALTPEILGRLRFSNRLFDHSFRLDDSAAHTAGSAALQARIDLLDRLIALDPLRWDWRAAKGTTEFWVGYRVDEGDVAARQASLAAAIEDLTAARDMAGNALPPEDLYWLTEARRWLPDGDDRETYLSLIQGGAGDYDRLRAAFDSGTWQGPLDRAELLASNTELLAKIADTDARILFDRADDWNPGDGDAQTRIFRALNTLAQWDHIRGLAVDAGTSWLSGNPGYPIAPGYLIGTVGGRLTLDGKSGAADACDVAASYPADPLRRAKATGLDKVDLDAALAACRALWSDNQDDPRLSFLLGRLLWLTDERDTLALDALGTAAAAGYAPAFNALAAYLETPDLGVPDADTVHLNLRHGFAQRTILGSFAAIYAYLEPLAATDDQRAGLRWLVERAAALGVPDAHIALGRAADVSPEDRAYHLEIAAQLVEDDDEARAEEIRAEIPANLYVDASDRAVDWRRERLQNLPADLIERLKDATN